MGVHPSDRRMGIDERIVRTGKTSDGYIHFVFVDAIFSTTQIVVCVQIDSAPTKHLNGIGSDRTTARESLFRRTRPKQRQDNQCVKHCVTINIVYFSTTFSLFNFVFQQVRNVSQISVLIIMNQKKKKK